MKHQVVFAIWTARELRGEGGVAIPQLWFSPYPAHPARAVAESGDDRGPESAGARRRNGCVWPKADLPRIQRLAHIAPGESRLRYGVLHG